METAISVAGLTKRYGDHTAVDGVTFQVERGESFGILGPNGAGKTTTLEMIEGLRKPDGGEITVLGRPVWPDPRAIQALIGVQLQSTSLFDMLTARELLAMLTDREREVSALVADGMSNAEIARQLTLSPLTVKTHVNHAMSKLGARDRAQLVVLAYQTGLARTPRLRP